MQSLAEPANIVPTAELVPVPAHRLMQYLRPTMALLDRVLSREGDVAVTDVYREVAIGNMQLWVVERDGEVIATVVTKLVTRPLRKVAQILYLAGVDNGNMPSWLHHLSSIEAWALAEGATRIEVVGRKGWKRVLSGYRMDAAVFRKDLKHEH